MRSASLARRSAWLWMPMRNQSSLIVRVTPCRSKRKGVAGPPVRPAKESLSTRICSRIMDWGTSPFSKPSPWLITCTQTGTSTLPRGERPWRSSRSSASIWLASISGTLRLPQRSRASAAVAEKATARDTASIDVFFIIIKGALRRGYWGSRSLLSLRGGGQRPRFRLRHVGADELVEGGEGNGAVGKDGVVERAEVEAIAELLLRVRPQLADLPLAHLVAEGLPRPRDVAVDLGRHLVQRERGVRGQVVDGLLPRPTHPVQTRVHDQAAGAPHLVGEAAEVAVGVGVEAGLEAEALRVQRPAFHEGADPRGPPERGQAFELALQGDL